MVTRLLLGTFVLAGILAGPHAAPAQEPTREITQIAGDLYRFQNNFHYSVFLVTPEGVIATDPIDAEAATWLEEEIKSRFDAEIRYLILSHDHSDHAAGGEVFADTAIVITHENAKDKIVGEQRPTAAPDITFSERMTVELGGKTVELFWPGKSHSDNLIVMRFPEQRALFAVDIVSVRRLPYQTLQDSWFPDWIESIRRIEAMDFDILVPGHGPLGNKKHVTEHRQYLEDLYNAVMQAAREEKTIEEMQAEITLDQYSEWGQFEDWRAMNIEGMARQVQLNRRGH
ncbi:MAG: MBL fold metallo-hydrolase [Geminicoccaceae bacterium]|nr:MBL fold metallo-hydrolase [Geminicoccaceae bacterium]